ncbi:MAG: TIGR03643 family protein, partial [Limnobacter sp.]|nr:TIGR03643 family protein [Limnobacter sp.]
FDAIETQFGLSESDTIKLMRNSMKPSSFRMWRKRVSGRPTKHLKKRGFKAGRAYASNQYKVR